jgi:exodeoxyribonuclease VII large subunit
VSDLTTLPFDDLPTSTPPRNRQVFTVSTLTAAIRTVLETTYREIWVEGEISNARIWKTGHLYFTLKDNAAQINAVIFRSTVRYLRFKPENGQHVIARGRVSVYDPKGEYQIVCEHLEPQGLGALQLAFEQLRERLHHEGLFDAGRKRPLPVLPKKIGIVTSLDGAAVKDILNVLGRRHPNTHVVISPTRVQGEEAAKEIVRALRHLERLPGVDVIIVARGGGSIEDLWGFNEESVARTIAAARVPVVSGVGHETDFTISDFVADLRAPTPSAAAELVVAPKDALVSQIRHAEGRFRSTVATGLQRRRTTMLLLERRLGLVGRPTRVANRGRYTAELTHRLNSAIASTVGWHVHATHTFRLRLEALSLGRRLGRIRARLVSTRTNLAHTTRRAHTDRTTRLHAAVGRLDVLSPLAVLSRGYAVCWTADRSVVIRDAAAVQPGQAVTVTLHNGELDCVVRSTK